jgi:hypothetical protein
LPWRDYTDFLLASVAKQISRIWQRIAEIILNFACADLCLSALVHFEGKINRPWRRGLVIIISANSKKDCGFEFRQGAMLFFVT